MKQLNNVALFAFLLFYISGFSQDSDTTNEDNPLSKGTIFLSGQSDFTAGLNGLDDSSSSHSSYSVSPTIGYFLINNLVVGAEVSFFGIKRTRRSEFVDPDLDFMSIIDAETKSRGISFAPFARYYFDTGKIKPYVSAGIGLGSIKAKNESRVITNGESRLNESENTRTSTIYTATGGAAIFLTKNVSIDTGVRYTNSTFKSELVDGGESENKNSNISLIGGISIYL